MYSRQRVERVQALAHDLGVHVVAARQARPLTQQELADLAGVSVASLHRLERGDSTVSVGILLGVLRALGLDGELLAALSRGR